MSEQSVRICPKCYGQDVQRDQQSRGIGEIAGINNWVCNLCGFSGRFFPLIDETELKSLKGK